MMLSAPARVAAAIILAAGSVAGAVYCVDRVPPAPPLSDERHARLIDLNSATPAELELLPRIGPALAGRIVQDRETNGPFKSLDDLQRVKGIGPITVQRLKGLAETRTDD